VQVLKDLESAFEDKLIRLYGKILEFQLRMIAHYSRDTFSRLIRDVAVSDDWKAFTRL
jgi:hypothetical protein